MTAYIIRRLLAAPLLLLGVSFVTFSLVHLTPGSPVDSLNLNSDFARLSPDVRASIERSLGIDRPFHEQYLTWLGGLVQGDLGLSLRSARPVSELMLERLPTTLLLTVTSTVLSLALAIPLGTLSALRSNSRLDQSLHFLSTLIRGIPSFWLAILCILFFAVQFQVWGLPALPAGGEHSAIDGGGFFDRGRHLILPLASLVLPETAGWVLYVRAQVLETMNAEFVQTARSKGLHDRAIMTRHVLRNALLPLVSFVAFIIPGLFAGASLIEQIFGFQGMGSLSIQAAQGKDYTLIMGTVMLVAALTILGSLIADLLQVVADPRVRLGARQR